jgi:23S rRNA (guanine2445-N2)-methyltransferase / 23S rRNA (guanine2069-N7)-methyltransferase
MTAQHHFFATVPKGMEEPLAEELAELGAASVAKVRAGASFTGTLETAYRACLWSRTASRILLPVATFEAPTAEALYEGIQTIRWSEHLSPPGTLAVDFSSSESEIAHTHFGALKVKDAIVDQLRSSSGERPSIDLDRPDLRVNVYLRKNQAIASIDLSGESLHRRGWRGEASPAPLKENLAAAILMLAEWPRIWREGGGLVDPMCGSGTLPIEAAMLACDVAPGLGRQQFGFTRWRGHRQEIWERLLEEARERDARHRIDRLPIAGYDVEAPAIRSALVNAKRAGLHGKIQLERRELVGCEPIGERPGVLLVNPPYGERIGDVEDLKPLYRRIGDTLKQRFPGWTGYVFTGNLELAKQIGLKIARRQVLFNGAIECRLLKIPIHEQAPLPGPQPLSPGAEMFSNRLRKNFKHLSKWAKREGVTCFRVYDADLPEYAVAVDLYERYVHVQEYQRPATVDASRAELRLHDALAVIPEVLGVRREDLFLKIRRRQRGKSQYQKLNARQDFREVREDGFTFAVNFTDYLDTGLFLDHRLVRKRIGELARGRRFLNLFAYTGTATVYAARGGASSTTSVDLSRTYLDWARRNLELNRIRGPRHELVRADCLEWIKSERRRYGLIFLDPPTFSRSKSMSTTFDVQRDHLDLLRAVARLLEPGGILVFSTNFQRFKMDAAALGELSIEEITRSTLPPDFARSPRIHRAYQITRRQGS